MTHRRMNPRRLPGGGGLDPIGISALWKDPTSLLSIFRQWLACFTASLTMLVVGTIYGWTTTSLLPLTTATGDVPLIIGQDDYSSIVSLTILCSIIGSLVGAQLADRRGRKYCLLVCSAIFTAGWIITYATTSVRTLFLARVIHGIGIGIAQTVNPMYVSEIANNNFRGSAGTLMAVNVHSGSLITCMLGAWLTYETTLVVLAIISFISLLSNMCFPETPYFLVAKGRKEQAWKSIAYYKDIVDPIEVNIELLDLRAETKHELHPESRYEMYQEPRSQLPTQSRTDLPSQTRSNVTLSSIYCFPSQTASDLPSRFRSDLPSTSKSNLPPQSITEGLSDPFHEADKEPVSDIHFLSTSDSPSTSVIHAQVVCDVHHPPTDESRLQDSRVSLELPLRPSCALPSQSAEELHRPSTSEIRRRSTSEIRRRSTSEIRRPSTSELQRLSTSELPLQHSRALRSQSASELHRPSTSEIQQLPTSETHQPSTSETHQPSTSETHQPSTSETHQPSTSGTHQPSTSETHQPSTSETHQPPTSETHQPSTSETHQPSTSGTHRPSISGTHQPSISGTHRPSTSGTHQPSTSETHQPSTSETHQPPTSETHQPSTSETHQPSTSGTHRPSISGTHQPSISGTHRPSTSGTHQPSISGTHRPSTREMNPDLISEIQSPSGGDLRTQSNVDLRALDDMDGIHMEGTGHIWLTKLRVILQRSNRTALFIMFGLILAKQFSGNYITMQYLEKLFNKTKIVFDPYESMLLVYLINLVSGTFTIAMVDYVGRKVLLYMSTIGSCFSLVILSYYFVLIENKFNISKFDMLPFIDLIIYQVSFQIGLGTLPNVFLCDLFPTELRGFVGIIIAIFDSIIGLIVSKLYEAITDNAEWYAIYFIFAASSCFAFMMVFMCIPETKGKTYREIQALLGTGYY